MHFVTGGSFNGKSAWVKDTHGLKESPHLWISFYHEEDVPDIRNSSYDCIVYEGIELWLKQLSIHHEPDSCREIWHQQLETWSKWEKTTEQRKIILIGNDLSKGIVPLTQEDRLWRDVTGWCYQETVVAANRVDLIWYGLNQQIK